MKFIELLSEDERIPYRHTPDHPVIHVRRVTIELRNEIQRRHQKIEHRNGRRDAFIPESNQVEAEKDYWDYIVLDWEDGLIRKRVGSTESAPCTRDWKYKLPDPFRQGILALADETNISGLRQTVGEPADVDPTRA